MPDSTIVERIPQAEAPTAAIPIDLRRQYASGGQGLWYGTVSRSLPWPIDDLSFSFGDDLYTRMLTESVVAGAVAIFKAGVLADGVSLSTTVSKKEADDYQQAADLVDWCERILADLDTHLDDVLWDMLNAIALGHKLAELVYDVDTSYVGKEQVVLKGLHVKPRRAASLVVDPYKTFLGVLALIPGQNVWPMAGRQIPDLAAEENFVPAEKFALFTFRPEDNDPRGTSILRAAYDPWWRKQQTKIEHQKYMSRFASPSLAGFTPRGALPVPRLDANGEAVLDATGAPVYDSPAEIMRDDLLAFQNGTVVVLPDGSSEGSRLQVIEVAGDGQAFLTAFEMHDREILKSILTVTLAVGEGEHASRAQSGVHMDAQQTLTGHAKKGVCRLLRSVLRRMVRYNYGDDAARLAPLVSLGGAAQEDIAKVWTAVGALKTSGYLDPSQYAELDAQVNLPARTAGEASVDDGTVSDAEETGEPTPAPAPEPPTTPPGKAPAPAADPGSQHTLPRKARASTVR